MAGEITYDHGETAPGIDAGTNTIPDGPQGGQHTGVDPSISDSVQTENSATGDELDRARGDGDKTKDASEKLDDNEHHNKRNMSDIGTDLSSDKGGRGGGPSMLGGGAPQGGGSAPQQAPAGGTPPSMPPMSPPSMPSGGASPAGMMSMPKDMMQGLLSNYNPDKANASTKDAAAVSDGKGVNADKIDPNSVEFKKTGIGPLTGSQLNATIEKALDLNGIPKDPSVRKQWHEVLGFMAAHESSRNPDAINTHDCVPIDNAILTQRGWLKYDEVRVGDMTLGYNADSGASEWTSITRVVVYDDAPVTRLSNSRWESISTDNHRWMVTRRLSEKVSSGFDFNADSCELCSWPENTARRGKSTKGGLRIHMAKKHGVKSSVIDSYSAPKLIATRDLTSRDNIILSVPARTDSRLDVSLVEAELLGWIAGDGHVEKRKHRPTISIAQSKPSEVSALKELLDGIPHSEYVDKQRPTRLGRKAVGPRYQFRLGHEWSQDLMRRAGHPKSNSLNIVLSMSTEQRAAWLKGITAAEGCTRNGLTSISQCYGTVLDAIIVAAYMEGYRPAVLDNKVTTPNWSPSARVSLNIPRTSVGMLSREPAGRTKVWCVTTELGSWTCRNDKHVFLTGNSNAHGAPAADGHPFNCSRGIWQCIPTTFAAHHVSGTSANIYDPVASCAASINYSMSRYHIDPNGGSSLQAFYASRMKGGYTGY